MRAAGRSPWDEGHGARSRPSRYETCYICLVDLCNYQTETAITHVAPPVGPAAVRDVMSPRQTAVAFTGLLAALSVAMLSSTVVMNALPQIVADLHGTQTGYAWVVVATLLSMTATTPMWGKLSDARSKLRLLQSAVAIYCVGSLVGTFATSMQMLLAARVIQGIGGGGLMALAQIVVAWIAPPRQRGRYAGYIGATYAVATVSGPLIGGFIADSPLGWRGCFFVSLPVAAAAVAILQASLRLPTVTTVVRLDLLGSSLIVSSVCLVLVWLSLAGHQFDWVSVETAILLGAGILTGIAAVTVELRHAVDPVLPLRLFRDRTVLLATAASALLGSAMFTSTLYPTQYFQLARGMSPSEAGLMTVSAVGALGIASVTSGRAISAAGQWKGWLVGGTFLVLAGVVLLGTTRSDTPLGLMVCYLCILGLGLGATNQNMVVAVQNSVDLREVGAASALVSFFRSMGGAIGVCATGAVLSQRTNAHFSGALASMPSKELTGPIPVAGEVPTLADLHDSVRAAYSASFGTSVGETFMVVAPLAAAAVACVLLIRPSNRTDADDPTLDNLS